MTDDRDLTAVLDDALGSWLASNGGGMVTGAYLIVEYVDPDGVPSWIYTTSPDQNLGKTMALVEWAKGIAFYEQQRYLADNERGD